MRRRANDEAAPRGGFEVQRGERVAVVTADGAMDSVDVLRFRSALLESTLVNRLTVVDLGHLDRISPPTVAAINSALMRMPGRESQLIVANASPEVAQVIRRHCPLVGLVSVEDTRLELSPEPA